MEDNKLSKLKKMYTEFNSFCKSNHPWPMDCGNERLEDILTEFLQVCGDVDEWVTSVIEKKPLNWEFIRIDEKTNEELISITPKTKLDKRALSFCREFKRKVDRIIKLLLEFKLKNES